MKAYEAVSRKTVAYKVVERRPGDIAECYAAPSLAKTFLGWQMEFDLAGMCEDTWRWQLNNPNGFDV